MKLLFDARYPFFPSDLAENDSSPVKGWVFRVVMPEKRREEKSGHGSI